MVDTGEVQIPRSTRALLNIMATVGISRQAALPVARRVSQSRAGSFVRQALSLAIGSSMIGIAVALLVKADLGLTPYDVMSSAIQQLTGLTLGQAGWALTGSLFALAAILGKRPSGWGLAYIFLNGVAIDLAIGLVESPDSLILRLAFVVASIPILAAAISLVVYSGTTGGAFELLMLAGEERGIDRIKVRYALDIGVFTLGILLGGRFGMASIIHMFSFGLMLRVGTQALLDHEAGREARIEASNRDASNRVAERKPQPDRVMVRQG